MNGLALRVATMAIRAWTRLYTWRMEPEVRDVRRAEIESDVWEHQNEGANTPLLPLEIVTRLVLGVPDDLSWRVEQMKLPTNFLRRKLVAIVSSVLFLVALWLFPFLLPAESPDPPPAPNLRWRPGKPPPPPPPPPPPLCNPPGVGAPAISPCSRS